MPYARNEELPDAVRRIVPDAGAQSIFRNTFNSSVARGLAESAAFARAYGAIQNAGWKRDAKGVYRKSADVDEEERKRLSKYADTTLDTVATFLEHVDIGVELLADIQKVDEEQRLVFGWFSVIEHNDKAVVDSQGDVIKEADLEKTAYEFVLGARNGGFMHEKDGNKVRVVGQLVESMMFTKEKQKALGIAFDGVGWWGGFKIFDDDAWQQVKDGKMKAFSIGGRGRRVPLAS